MSDNPQKDLQEVILCEMCTEEDRKPARKTCMKCEISMCVQHLQAHLTTPVLLQTHPLTDPMVLCGTTKCPHHGKLVEYYCLDDMTCVCVSCAIEDQHRLHNMKTFSTAHKELMEKLKTEQKEILVKTDNKDVSLEKWEKSEREKLARSSVRLIDAVTKLRDISLASVQSSVAARMVSIQKSKSSMEAAQKETDTFRFLQMYSQVHQDVEKAKAVDLRRGLEPGCDRDKLVQEIRQGGEKILEQAGQFWGSLLTLVDPENNEELVATSSDITFDPRSLRGGMSLSKDNRKIFYGNQMEQFSAHILRLQSTQSVPDYRRWVISLTTEFNWVIGLCDKKYAKQMTDGDVYGLCCQGGKFSSLKTEYDPVLFSCEALKTSEDQNAGKPPKEQTRKVCAQVINPPDGNVTENMAEPQTVEVVWSLDNSLSFFRRIGCHQRIKLVSIKISTMNWELEPFVCLKKAESQKSSNTATSNVLQLQQIGFSSTFAQHSQEQWTCSCGMTYNVTSDGYSHGRQKYQKSSGTCSCGVIIGTPQITEVLCELL